MFKIAREALPALFAKMAEIADLFLPVKNNTSTEYARFTPESAVDLDTLKTAKSPKDLFFPQSETLYTCHRDGKKLSVVPEKLAEAPFIVFGMRACDIQGVAVLDRVFLSEPQDSFYAARRQNGLLIGMACTEPEESCFCGTFGIDHTAPGGDVDTMLTKTHLYWMPCTEKGQVLTEKLADLLQEAKEDALDKEKEKAKALMEAMPYKDVSVEGWGAAAADKNFDSPLWESLAKPCLACGTCTFVCPTCQCYDIKDYETGHGVKRYRCWDSCMYSDFTMMAHGNNRTTQMQRFRQRFMHKLAYFPANNDGMFSCVGCGRCVEKCPSALNIVKVIKAFGGEQHA